MGRAVGSKKYGGRKKGTPNKKTQELQEFFNSVDFSIPEVIMKILPSLKSDKQIDVLLKMMEFVYPKRKAIDISPIDISNRASIDVSKLSKQELLFLKKLHDR